MLKRHDHVGVPYGPDIALWRQNVMEFRGSASEVMLTRREFYHRHPRNLAKRIAIERLGDRGHFATRLTVVTMTAPTAQSLPISKAEISEALLGSVAVYGIAAVRQLARSDAFPSEVADRAMQLPVARVTMMDFLMHHTKEIKTMDSSLYLSAIEQLTLSSISKYTAETDPVNVVVVDDELSSKELVYLIAVDK